MNKMATLFDKQASVYLDSRPKYPQEWFSKLAALTSGHTLAWDVGTGNGQAAISVADHYNQVIATDISAEQIEHAIAHPKVKYIHTPSSMSDDEVVALFGGERSVDLVTVAVAVHWFDLNKFYNLVKRLLKPGGIIAVWTYSFLQISPEVDILTNSIYEDTSRPFRDPRAKYAIDCYKTLPFPFESVGMGCEGHPLELDKPKEMSLEGLLGLVRSSEAINTAKKQGVELLSEDAINAFRSVWGGSESIRTVNYKVYLLAGKVKF